MSIVSDGQTVLTPTDLEEISGWVWSAFLADDGSMVMPLLAEPVDTEGEVVHASVGVHGAWNGQVLLELTEDTALDVARAMLQTDEVTPEDVSDAVGEKENLRLTRGDDPAPRRADSETGRQPIGPDKGAVHAAIAIEVVQSLDRAVRLGLGGLLVPLVRLDPAHHPVELPAPVQLLDVVLPFQVVAVQFGDEELPALIPAHARRLVEERLARHHIGVEGR